ncbi:hypothetical protein ACLKMY_00735 [Paraburkholderia mimosarum]|uniref:hypothetical protein n=1 Tax=Paraburkholderia mimosarum TaxID=312026 RepID=UPI0039C14285
MPTDKNRCDCLVDCGDDPAVTRGTVEACAYLKRRQAERQAREAREGLQERVTRLLIDLHASATLSEQQCAKVLGVDLIAWREIEGNQTPIDGDQGSTLMFDLRPTDATCTVAGVTLFGPADNVRGARAALEAAPLPTYPDEITPELREVLGWPNFRCGPVAHVFQAAGYDIAERAEDEQAFVLHWFVKLVLRHGADWWSVASDELSSLQERIKAAPNGKLSQKEGV